MHKKRKKTDTPDRFLYCWSCRTDLSSAAIRKDGIIQSRKEKHGGPFYIYKCPECKTENKCEITCIGHFFASPPHRPALSDWLFEKLWQSSPAEYFLRLSAWFDREEEKRQFLFERDGDLRYSPLGYRIRSFFFQGKKEKTGKGRTGRSAHKKTTSSIPSPYRILGVSTDASTEEIKQAFFRLIRKHHPDKAHHLGPEVVKKAEKKFKKLLEAYERLLASSRKYGDI